MKKKREDYKKCIALFDILGYKELIKRNSVNTLLSKLRKFNKEIPKITFEKKHPCKLMNIAGIKNKTILYSDSILIYSNGITEDHFGNLCAASMNLFGLSLQNGIPIRGAITIGELYVENDKSLYFGKGFIRAYELANKQDWCGIIIDDKLNRNDYPHIKRCLDDDDFFCEYDVPMKDGEIKKFLCLDWVSGVIEEITSKDIKKSLYQNNKNLDWPAKRKIDATLQFFEYRKKKEANPDENIEWKS